MLRRPGAAPDAYTPRTRLVYRTDQPAGGDGQQVMEVERVVPSVGSAAIVATKKADYPLRRAQLRPPPTWI